MKFWIAIPRCSCATTAPRSIHLQASVWQNQNASAAGSPSKPEDYHRVNTLFTSLDKVLAEIEDRFSWNDQVVLCDYYNFDKELLHGDQRLFNHFKQHMSRNQWSKRQMSLTYYMKTASMKLHQSSRRWLLFSPSFPQHHAQRIVRSADFSGDKFTFVTPWDSIDSIVSLSSVLSAPMEIKSLSTVWTRWLTFSDNAMERRTFSFNTS